MFLRWLVGIIIIGVAVTLTTALVRLSYFPEESRLAKEEPKLVLERFLSRTSAESMLDIWKGREIVGSLRVTPYTVARPEMTRFQAQGRIKVEADLLVALPGLDSTWIKLLSNMYMAYDGSVQDSELELSASNFPQRLNIHHHLNAPEPIIQLKQGNLILMDTSQKQEGADALDGVMGLFLRSVGIDSQELKHRQTRAQQTTSTTEARGGGFTVEGRNFTGYVLTTTIGGPDRKFTLYISESGELVQMKTSFLDYQFISEDLRPAGIVSPSPLQLPLKKRPSANPKSP